MRTAEPKNQVIMASRAIERGLGELLGSKHLYQSVVVQVKVEGLLVEVKSPGEGRKELIRSAESNPRWLQLDCGHGRRGLSDGSW